MSYQYHGQLTQTYTRAYLFIGYLTLLRKTGSFECERNLAGPMLPEHGCLGSTRFGSFDRLSDPRSVLEASWTCPRVGSYPCLLASTDRNCCCHRCFDRPHVDYFCWWYLYRFCVWVSVDCMGKQRDRDIGKDVTNGIEWTAGLTLCMFLLAFQSTYDRCSLFV